MAFKGRKKPAQPARQKDVEVALIFSDWVERSGELALDGDGDFVCRRGGFVADRLGRGEARRHRRR